MRWYNIRRWIILSRSFTVRTFTRGEFGSAEDGLPGLDRDWQTSTITAGKYAQERLQSPKQGTIAAQGQDPAIRQANNVLHSWQALGPHPRSAILYQDIDWTRISSVQAGFGQWLDNPVTALGERAALSQSQARASQQEGADMRRFASGSPPRFGDIGDTRGVWAVDVWLTAAAPALQGLWWSSSTRDTRQNQQNNS